VRYKDESDSKKGMKPKSRKKWKQEELPFYDKPYKPHQSPDEFFRNVSKPDPSTVEAELQQEETLWEN